MASVRDTVYKMLVEYPSLFRTVGDCYTHLFLVNGNGYDWVDGELVDVCRPSEDIVERTFNDDEDAEVMERLSRFSVEPVTELKDGEGNYIRLEIRREKMQIQFVKDNFDLMFDEYLSVNPSYYSGRNYNKMCQMPDDVKDDWKEAIQDFMHTLRPTVNQRLKYAKHVQDGIAELQKDLNWLEKEKFPANIKNRQMVEKMLKDIVKNKE